MIVFPNAKINIGLRVIQRRNDGFHDIETLMVPLKLADALEVTPSSDGLSGITLSGIPVDGTPDSNLCMKAFKMMQQRFGLPEVKIHLHKVIPTGAGLGGGSSDAAFTLKLLNRLFSLKISNKDLESLAAELGSDCPFFIENQPCLVTGRGEVLKPVQLDFSHLNILVVKPDVNIPTAWAYTHIKPSGHQLPGPGDIPEDISTWSELYPNDFEMPVFKAWPEIASIKKSLLDMGALYASLSGSGSAVFGFFEKIPDYQDAFKGKFVWEGNVI